ncbi:MAG: hypothetical protein K0U93_07180 [Gammaproteobacteria bacterium]|nr:hypothetical protein [Gammaproteobacteria bacterium]
MSDAPEGLVLDLVEWVAKSPRPYREVMDAWRTSCPRLTVWEDAVERGLVVRQMSDGGPVVWATGTGRDLLKRSGRSGHPSEQR